MYKSFEANKHLTCRLGENEAPKAKSRLASEAIVKGLDFILNAVAISMFSEEF